MKEYTGMYIVHPKLTEDEVQAVIDEINAIFESRSGEMLEVNKWGMKDLAYEIEDCKKGYYVKFRVKASNEAVDEYDRICNIKESVIRHILVKD